MIVSLITFGTSSDCFSVMFGTHRKKQTAKLIAQYKSFIKPGSD